ncbi:MAG: phosphohistidine phosphatase SixA [Deltaproteobacteria bacterium]|nr:phosphohistidine phosphatase SixA [Deltaproteobacteria bacterium]
MLLYLVQHAEAKKEEEDPKRSLSTKGIQDIKKIADFLAKLNVRADKIYHSGKTRAFQTAVILTEYLEAGKGISETNGLSPLDDPQIWFERINNLKEDTILVGHLPHLSKLSSLLLFGDTERHVIDFKMAGVVCLKRFENNWAVDWMIIPEVVK